MSVNALVLNDVHAAASPPAGAKDAWVDDVLSMLDQARTYAIERDCQYTIFTGDLFHAKNNVPHWLVRHLMELFCHWPGTKFAIVGNHDLGHGGIDSVPRQPIGVLFEAGVLTWLREDVVTAECDPAINDEDDPRDVVRFQWSPVNYFDEIDGTASKPPFENRDAAHYGLKRQKNVDWAIKVAHGMLVPPKQKYPFAYTPYSAVPTKGMDVMLYGHPHYDTGCVEHDGVWFCSYGSVGRVARTQHNRERPMRLLLLKFGKEEIEREVLPLKALPSADIFYEMEADGVEITAPMERFARSVKAALASNDLGSLEDSIDKGADSRAKKRLIQYIEAASE